MSTPNESDCWHTDELVCPYCGDEQSDSWEHTREDGETDCGSCSRPFRYSRHVSVSYTTRPIMGPHRLSEWQQQQEREEDA